MLVVVFFIALAGLCCAIAAINGGWEGRWAALLTVLAIAIGRVAGSIDMLLATSPGFKLYLDGALLLGFGAIMFRSRRWWPIWISGFQMNGVLAHITALVVPHHTPAIYRGLESFWGVLIVVTMALGATLDRREQNRPLPRPTSSKTEWTPHSDTNA